MHIRILHSILFWFIDNSPFLIRTRTCPSNADLITWLSTAALAVHCQVDLQRPLTAHRVHFDDRIPIFLVVWAFEGLSKCSIYFPQSLPYLTFLPVLLKTNKLKLPTYNASTSPYRDLHLELDLVPDIESLARGSLLHLPVLALAEETHWHVAVVVSLCQFHLAYDVLLVNERLTDSINSFHWHNMWHRK